MKTGDGAILAGGAYSSVMQVSLLASYFKIIDTVVDLKSLRINRCIIDQLQTSHWRQRRRGCRGHIPTNILVGGGRQWEYPPPILVHTFGHSRPILVALRSSRFPSAIRCRQFASVWLVDSGFTRLAAAVH